RKDYKGGEATAYANYTQHPGGRGWGTNALVGWGDIAKDSFNATMSFDYRKQDALYGRDRPFASSGINPDALNDTTSGNTFPANFAAATGSGFSFGSHNPSYPNCPGPYAINDPFFGTSCRFDPSPLVSLLPESEQ